jgi:hypothetical protein
MTVKDFKKQIAPYSVDELHLFELAIYQELERRGVVPVFKEDPKLIEAMKTLDEGIDLGTTQTLTLSEFKNRMANHRGK